MKTEVSRKRHGAPGLSGIHESSHVQYDQLRKQDRMTAT